MRGMYPRPQCYSSQEYILCPYSRGGSPETTTATSANKNLGKFSMQILGNLSVEQFRPSDQLTVSDENRTVS